MLIRRLWVQHAAVEKGHQAKLLARCAVGTMVCNAVLLQPISMAPKKNGGKMAMKMAAKSKAAPKHKETQKTRIKQEKTSPRRTQKAKKETEVEVQDGEAPSSSKETLGYPRGTISALLTSLRYQPKSKKLSAEEKQDAAKALEDR